MTDAPKTIWAQDAVPDECNYIGGGWWDDSIGSTQYPHMVEYTRADTVAAQLKAADELADAIDEWQISRAVGCLDLEQAKAGNVARLRTAYRKAKDEAQ